MKLPHHGDSSANLLRLLRQTRPLWAVETVSAAETVEPELLAALAETETALFLTRDGPVSVVWNGTDLSVVQE